MRVLEQADYLKIFIRALQYSSIEQKEAYFLGKFNEHKDCNPLPLFIDGLSKADKQIENIIKERYTKDLQEYQLACKVDADNKEQYVEPTLDSVEHPCFYIDNEMWGHYNYSDILKIRQGYMSFKLSIINDNRLSKPQPTAKPEPSQSQPESLFTPQTDTLKDWLKPDYIKPFVEIEQELFDRGYIDANYKWQKGKTKKDLIDLLTILVDYRIFKEIVKGKRKQLLHYRQFISERYGFGKTGLTETSKKYKPNIENARASFLWIKKPA